MERVDVEISPWMPEDVKRTLERVVEQEAKEAEEKERIEHEAYAAREALLEKLQADLDVANTLTARVEESLHKAEAEVTRLAAVNAEIPIQRATTETMETPVFRTGVRATVRESSRPQYHHEPSFHAAKDVPLGNLLVNYVCILAQDKRNIVMAALSGLVLLLSISILGKGATPTNISSHIPPTTVHQPLSSVSSLMVSAPNAAASSVLDLLPDNMHQPSIDKAPLHFTASSAITSSLVAASSATSSDSSSVSSSVSSLGSTASAGDARALSTEASPPPGTETP
jgi:hypothetical protein